MWKGVPKWEVWKEQKKIVEGIIAEKSPDLMKNLALQAQQNKSDKMKEHYLNTSESNC